MPLPPPAPRLPIVRIVDDSHPLGYRIINQSDFDPAVHTKHATDGTPVAYLPPATMVGPRLEPSPPYRPPLLYGAKGVPTVRVVQADAPGGFVRINAADFDPAVHTLYDRDEEHASDPDLPDVPDDLAALSYAALRELAKRHGVKASGSRADLQDALLDKFTAAAHAPAPASGPSTVTFDPAQVAGGRSR